MKRTYDEDEYSSCKRVKYGVEKCDNSNTVLNEILKQLMIVIECLKIQNEEIKIMKNKIDYITEGVPYVVPRFSGIPSYIS
jgi:hypothetical protein